MKQNGMSMIEVMIGVFLLALILLPSLNVITSQTKTVNSTRDHAQVSFIAQNIIEQCRSYQFDLIEADHHTEDNKKGITFEYKLLNTDDPTLNKITMNGIEYIVNKEKTKIDYIDDNNKVDTPVVLFKLVIDYKGQDGKDHDFDVSTAIFQRE